MGFGKGFWSVLSARPVGRGLRPLSHILTKNPLPIPMESAILAEKPLILVNFSDFPGFARKITVHGDWIGFWKLFYQKYVENWSINGSLNGSIKKIMKNS